MELRAALLAWGAKDKNAVFQLVPNRRHAIVLDEAECLLLE